MGPANPVKGTYFSPVERNPFDVPLSEKVLFLKEIDSHLQDGTVAHRYITNGFQHRHVHYWNSEGTEFERLLVNCFGRILLMAPDPEGKMQRRSTELYGDGKGARGYEFITNPEFFSGHVDRLKSELSQLVSAETLSPEERDVILLPGQGFLQVHETIGHPLELDRILGYELSFAGGSHVTLDSIGKLRYGSEKLNCRSGVVDNSPGHFGYDDEGTEQREYMLIDKGILVGVLSSRATMLEANTRAGRTVVVESGTAARASAYYRSPIERMTDIDIDPGDDGTLEDIVADTENGVILDVPVSWSIGSNREHFHFGCEIAWEVRDGKRTKVCKNPTYQAHTLDFWRSLDKVGDASTWRLQQVPNCGKGEPNQIMELGHGVPVMRFTNVQTGEKGHA
jgi:TldD protein